MGLMTRLARLNKTLPGSENCPICYRPHLRNVAQFVVWYDEQVQQVIPVGHDPRQHYCTCVACGCAEMTQAMHDWKSNSRLKENRG